MKVFDLHIGVSDSVIITGKNSTISTDKKFLFPNQFDTVRAKKGELDIFCGMMCPVVLDNDDFVLPMDMKSEIRRHISVYKNMQAKGEISFVNNYKDFEKKGLKIILGLEGFYGITTKKDLEFLGEIIEKGVRVIGPMWNFKNPLFMDPKFKEVKKDFYRICKKNNIIIDLAHSEDTIFEEILNDYDGSVYSSHTNLFTLKSHRRNIKPEQIKKIISRGGIVSLTFVGEFLGEKSIKGVIEQFQLFVDEFGDDSISLGSDFDGMDFSDVVEGLEDVSNYQNFSSELEKRLGKKTVKKILYENSLNFYKKIRL